jgi:hypothetical protein
MFGHSLRRFGLITLSLLLAISGLSVIGATAASASCPAEWGIEFTANANAWLATNVYSAWLTGPGTISLSTTKTATYSTTTSVSVGVSIGTLIAKAEAKFGKDWTNTWSVSSTWTYSVSVPSGQTARAVMYKKGSRLSGYKWSVSSTCTETITNFYMYTPFAGDEHCYGKDASPASTVVLTSGCAS